MKKAKKKGVAQAKTTPQQSEDESKDSNYEAKLENALELLKPFDPVLKSVTINDKKYLV